MKTKILIVPICAVLAFTSCQKEKSVPLGGNTSTKSTNGPVAAHRTGLISLDLLGGYLPAGPNAPVVENLRTNADATINEVSRSYDLGNGKLINMSVGDFVNAPFELNELLVGRGIIMSTATDAISGILVNLLSDNIATNVNMMLAQSTNRGAIDFALASDGWTSLIQASNGLNLATSDVTQFTYSTGSSISAYANADVPNVSGWEIYDAKTSTAMVILSVPDGTGDRLGYVLEQTLAPGLDQVKVLASSIDFASISDL